MSLTAVPPRNLPNKAPTPLPAPSAPGVHDTLRKNLALALPSDPSVSSTEAATTTQDIPLQSTHPLEARLKQWDLNSEQMKMVTWRHTAGLAGPVWRGIEMQQAKIGEWKPALLGGNGRGVHTDVLAGRDWECSWEDVFGAGAELREVPDFHAEMEARLRMNW